MFAPPITSYQNGTSWFIELLHADGTRLKTIDTAGPFSMTSVIGGVGTFSLVLPQGFDKSLIAIDRRVRFNRKPAGGAQYVEFEGILRHPRTEQDDNDLYKRTLMGPSLEYIVSSRVIQADVGDAKSDKTGAIDDLMKAYVAEQLGASAGARQMAAGLFTADGNVTLGPSTTKSASYRVLADTLHELSDAARAAGNEVYWGIVPTPPGFVFRTYVGQPGADRSTTNPLIFGPKRGNLRRGVLDEDWTNEANSAIALGLGTGAARITTATAARSTNSLLALREVTVSQPTATGGTEAANSLLTASRPAITFTGELQSTGNTIYGRDFFKFDKVLIDFDDRQFPGFIRSVTVSVDENGYETIIPYVEAYL